VEVLRPQYRRDKLMANYRNQFNRVLNSDGYPARQRAAEEVAGAELDA
jgi:hypothetical protein